MNTQKGTHGFVRPVSSEIYLQPPELHTYHILQELPNLYIIGEGSPPCPTQNFLPPLVLFSKKKFLKSSQQIGVTDLNQQHKDVRASVDLHAEVWHTLKRVVFAARR